MTTLHVVLSGPPTGLPEGTVHVYPHLLANMLTPGVDPPRAALVVALRAVLRNLLLAGHDVAFLPLGRATWDLAEAEEVARFVRAEVVVHDPAGR
jgi:hypothetical protein